MPHFLLITAYSAKIQCSSHIYTYGYATILTWHLSVSLMRIAFHLQIQTVGLWLNHTWLMCPLTHLLESNMGNWSERSFIMKYINCDQETFLLMWSCRFIFTNEWLHNTIMFNKIVYLVILWTDCKGKPAHGEYGEFY